MLTPQCVICCLEAVWSLLGHEPCAQQPMKAARHSCQSRYLNQPIGLPLNLLTSAIDVAQPPRYRLLTLIQDKALKCDPSDAFRRRV